MISKELKQRLTDWLEGKERPPYKIILFPTGFCNLNCKFCKNDHGVVEELSDEKIMRTVKEGIDLGVEEWWITGGGEPLMRKNLTLNIVEEIKGEDKFCDLMTNGTLLDDETIERLVRCGLDRILISLDGPSATVNDKIRGKGVFDKVIKSIKRINYYKEEFKSEKPEIQISSVINSYNYNKLVEMAYLAQELGVDELELHQMLVYEDTRKTVSDLILDDREKEELTENIKEVKDISDNFSLNFNSDALDLQLSEDKELRAGKKEKDETQFFCFQPFYTLLIDMAGKVAPCCPGGSSARKVDFENRTLRDIWYGEYLTGLRDQVIAGNKMDFCENCGVNNLREDLLKEFNEQ